MQPASNAYSSENLFPLVLAIPVMILVFMRIYRHYLSVARELSALDRSKPAIFRKLKHTVIVPISGIHQGVQEALQYALAISSDVRACYVDINPEATARMKAQWETWAPSVPFTVLNSPYRSVIAPLMTYIDQVEKEADDDLVTVVIPEFVTSKWWHQLLHNHTAVFIRAALTLRQRKVVTSVRYHLTGVH